MSKAILEQCSDNRFEVIEKAKKDLIESTNIEGAKDEMKVLDSFLFRAWQMGWLKQYDDTEEEIVPQEVKELSIELSIDDVLNKFNEELKQMNKRLDEQLKLLEGEEE